MGNKLGAFLAGGLAGAVIALLYAPRSGQETRAMVTDKMNNAWGEAQELGAQASANAQHMYQEATAKGQDFAQNVAEKGQQFASAAQSKGQELYGAAASRVQENTMALRFGCLPVEGAGRTPLPSARTGLPGGRGRQRA